MPSSERKTVAGKEFYFAKYASEDALVMLFKLQQKFAKAFGIFLEDLDLSKGVDWESFLGSKFRFSDIFESAMQKIDPYEIPALAKDILRGTQVKEGDRLRDVELNIDFAGNPFGIMKLIYEVLNFQFSFLDALAAKKSQPLAASPDRIQAKSLT